MRQTLLPALTQKTYKINHKYDCNDKYLIYLLTCKKYMIKYVGKIVNEFLYR